MPITAESSAAAGENITAIWGYLDETSHLAPETVRLAVFFLRMGGAEAESKTINKSKIFKRKQTAKLVGFNLFPNQTKVQAVRLKQGVSQH